MGNLIEFIFSNFFIVIMMIAGLMGFFRNSKQEEQHPERPIPRPAPASPPQQTQSGRQRKEETIVSSESIKEQQNKQIDRLAKHLHTAKTTGDTDSRLTDTLESPLREPGKGLTKQQEETRSSIKRNLNRKGLVNGIVMSEVLGPPRAKRPYRSVLSQRKY
ncbi:hypothetical protein ACFOGI_02390 [Virgibacillus xinjiangensis]|uniref:Uncharacterized protein n=1 Tax=Virgibacillus xinjiangensis TaxID=393090 RepID=A0ABV7CS50_9BACI